MTCHLHEQTYRAEPSVGEFLTAERTTAKELIVLSHPVSTDSDERLVRLAEWMGVPARRLEVDESKPIPDDLDTTTRHKYCIAVSAATLTAVATASGVDPLLECLTNRVDHLLVFFSGHPAERGDDALAWLSSRQFHSCRRRGSESSVFHLSKKCKKYSRQLAGLEFTTETAKPVPVFQPSEAGSSRSQTIMRAGGWPMLVRTQSGRCEIFLAAASDVPDIRTPVSSDGQFEQYYDRLIPILIVLRHCFPNTYWHGESSTARLIIDDPLLETQYGFMNYTRLLESMKSLGYGTSIGFIPWNYWRTSKEQARFFIANQKYFSICVHGCDHSNREFGDANLGLLNWKAQTALRRMRAQEQKTGLRFEQIMIFPQDWFSTHSLAPLRESNYLAAISTTCFPRNEWGGALTLGDLLRPAITNFDGLPIFQRRFPKRIVDSAFDIFLGRPALFIEHHDYFRLGYESVEDLVRGLREVESDLTWPSLTTQLTKCCLKRKVSEHKTEIRYFTRRFSLCGTDSCRVAVVLSKHEPNPSAISCVLINGVRKDFEFRGEFLVVELEVDPGETVDVAVVDRPVSETFLRPTLSYSAAVPLRRALSEFRDKAISKHPKLLSVANDLARRMKMTAN